MSFQCKILFHKSILPEKTPVAWARRTHLKSWMFHEVWFMDINKTEDTGLFIRHSCWVEIFRVGRRKHDPPLAGKIVTLVTNLFKLNLNNYFKRNSTFVIHKWHNIPHWTIYSLSAWCKRKELAYHQCYQEDTTIVLCFPLKTYFSSKIISSL